MIEITPENLHSPALTVVRMVQPSSTAPVEATTDERVIELWIHGRPSLTQRAYRADTSRFQCFVSKPLHSVTLCDLQQYADSLVAAGLSPASRHRKLTAVKSLFGFATRLGYLLLDPARALRVPAVTDTLSSRILTEAEVLAILNAERRPRNHALLCTAYATGARVSELAGLTWGNVVARDEGRGQVTLLGKRGKVRSVLIPATVFCKLIRLRRDGAGEHDPVFRSRLDRPLSAAQMLAIVKAAAQRAGIERKVVFHSLRHCHCSHALDRGAPISLVSASAGHADLKATSRYCHVRPNDSSSRFLGI